MEFNVFDEQQHNTTKCRVHKRIMKQCGKRNEKKNWVATGGLVDKKIIIEQWSRLQNTPSLDKRNFHIVGVVVMLDGGFCSFFAFLLFDNFYLWCHWHIFFDGSCSWLFVGFIGDCWIFVTSSYECVRNAFTIHFFTHSPSVCRDSETTSLITMW